MDELNTTIAGSHGVNTEKLREPLGFERDDTPMFVAEEAETGVITTDIPPTEIITLDAESRLSQYNELLSPLKPEATEVTEVSTLQLPQEAGEMVDVSRRFLANSDSKAEKGDVLVTGCLYQQLIKEEKDKDKLTIFDINLLIISNIVLLGISIAFMCVNTLLKSYSTYVLLNSVFIICMTSINIYFLSNTTVVKGITKLMKYRVNHVLYISNNLVFFLFLVYSINFKFLTI